MEVHFKHLKPEERKDAIYAVPRYLSEARKIDRPLVSARTYLEQQVWRGFEGRLEEKSKAANGPAVIRVWPGTEQWDAWEAHFRGILALDRKNREASEAVSTMKSRAETGKSLIVSMEWPPELPNINSASVAAMDSQTSASEISI